MRRGAGLLLLGALACADGNATPAGEAAQSPAAAATASPDSAPSTRLRPLHLARLEERAPTTFPHAPHLRFECTRCHAQVAGHERHANVGCRQCHEAPAPTTAGASGNDCQSCHHAGTQPFGCRHCHDQYNSPGVRTVSLTLRLASSGAQPRAVAFPHARHAELDCTRCHAPGPAAAAAANCTECHVRHHRATADCAACHSPPRAGVHQAAVHRGCGGEGCHRDATVLALPLTRAVCLGCHPAQATHEPGGDCAGCHDLRPAGTGRARAS